MTPQRSHSGTRRYVLKGIGTAVCGASIAGCSDTSDDDSAETDASVGETPRDGATNDTSADSIDGAGNDTDADGDRDDTGESDGSCETETIHEGYSETTVQIVSNQELVGSVTAAIADTDDTRRIGLSTTECLPENRGMLFVYDTEQRHTFWMRGMDFGIDIVYISEDGLITAIHHAEKPGPDESGTENKHRYSGDGQYVLEVSYEWTTRREVETGDKAIRGD